MGRILDTLGKDYLPASSPRPQRPEDFNILGEVARGKGYLGLIYADANNMGRALEEKKTLKELQDFAEKIDKAVFEAMARAIRAYLPVAHHSEYGDLFPFDVLLIGGDDIAMVTPADKAMQVAHMLADQFYQITAQQFSEETYTLSVGVVLAPAKYPFSLQYELVDETLKAAKKASAKRQAPGTSGNQSQEQSLVNFVVLTGSTSLSYEKQYEEMQGKNSAQKTEHYATLRPYNLADLDILLEQLKKGNELRLGRTKLHQLREAILKLNNTTAILEALMLLRNWRKKEERTFIRQIVSRFEGEEPNTSLTAEQPQTGTYFPWFLDVKQSSRSLSIYRTPLLDFIELYDFVS